MHSKIKRWFTTGEIEDTIVVTGAPRSGTTWLSEVVSSLPGYARYDEPLHLTAFPKTRTNGFEWRTYLDPYYDADEQAAYLLSVFSGRSGNGLRLDAATRIGRLMELVRSRRQIVKFVRAGRMLQWMACHFDLRGIHFIIRHPCAAVSSMIKHRDWSDFSEANSIDAYLGGSLPLDLKEDIERRLPKLPDTPAERLAFLWTLDHYIPFHHFARHGYPWTLVPYEMLLKDGPNELKRIFAAVNAEVPDDARNHLAKASDSASEDLQLRKSYRQLSKWKKNLDSGQIDSILKIVDAFDLDFYTEAAEPDYSRLLRFQTEDSSCVE